MEIVITSDAIARRVGELAQAIDAYYRQQPFTMVVTLSGAMIFAADLMRRIETPHLLDTIAVASYQGEQSSGVLKFRSHLKLPVAGKRLLVVDDILDSGMTLAELCRHLKEAGADEVRTCVLLDKQVPRTGNVLQKADWHGFQVPPLFLVGYGLDCDEKYRHFPDIRA